MTLHLTSPVKFGNARGDDIVVDACDMLFRFTQLPINGSRVSAHCAVDYGYPLQQTFLGMRLRQDHLRGRAGARKSPGRDPPPYRSVRPPRRPVMRPVRVPCSTTATNGTVRLLSRASSPSVVLSLLPESSRQRRRRRTIRLARDVVAFPTDSHGDRNIGEAQACDQAQNAAVGVSDAHMNETVSTVGRPPSGSPEGWPKAFPEAEGRR